MKTSIFLEKVHLLGQINLYKRGTFETIEELDRQPVSIITANVSAVSRYMFGRPGNNIVSDGFKDQQSKYQGNAMTYCLRTKARQGLYK